MAQETPKPEPIRLSRFLPTLNTAQVIQRTATYTADPRTYLEQFHGQVTFQERSHLFSIPESTARDIYGTGAHKTHFEAHVAKLFGKKHGLFFVSGVQAQLAALKAHCVKAKNNRLAWHSTSHLESAELAAYEELYGLERIFLGNDAKKLPTVAEIKDVVSLPAEKRPAAILVEIPNRMLGCATYSFSELEELSAACKQANVKFHMDGARFWDIEPYYVATAGKSFAEVSALFDTVYVSMYKALGGAAGAVLLSDDTWVHEEAKFWQRRAGGNLVTVLYEVADAERGFNENIGSFAQKRNKMLEISEAILTATKKYVNADGERIIRFNPETPTCCNTHTAFKGFTREQLKVAAARVAETKNVFLFKHIGGGMSLDDMLKEDREIAEKEANGTANGTASESTPAKPAAEDSRDHKIEWWISPESLLFDTQLFVDAYVALCEELLKGE